MNATITPEDLAAARAQFAEKIADCPFCGGWSKPDPRRAPTHYETVICLGEAQDAWYVRCFSCFACTTSTDSAADAVERWNRRTGAAERKPELLPLVDLQSLAHTSRIQLTLDAEGFAIAVQRAVLSRNARPLQ